MKRKLIILAMFILLILAAIPTAMAACSHTCTWRITKSSTCTVAGSKKYQCTKCNTITKTATIPAKGHNPTTATCTTASKCTRCNATISPAKGHSWGSWTTTVNPTCVAAGKKVRKCSACSQQETQGINVTAHTYRWVTTNNATCTAAGSKKYVCSYCEAVNKTESIPKLGHNPTATTCTAASKCTRCNAEISPAKGHSWGSWTTTVNPTCVTAGKKVRKCSTCSQQETQGINVTAHTYKWVTTSNATCTAAGSKKYVCSYCEAVNKTESIPKIAHTMGSWTTNYDSTCVNPGQKERKCSKCTYKETQGIALKAHTYKWVTTNNPTCTKTGEKRYMCSYCDYWEQSEIIPKVAHTLGNWTTNYDSTCVNPGQKERKCANCTYKETQGIALKAHTYKWVTTNNPTCTKTGEKRYMCSYCDYWEQSEVIPKVAHTLGNWTTNYDSTCVNPGQKERRCANCTYKETQGIALKAHTYKWVTTNSPTCTKPGEKRYMCSYCDYWEQSEPIAKLGHDLGDWVTTHEPNCTNPGQKEKSCSRCSYKETQGIGVTNHDYQWVTVSNPTCTQLGEKRYMCKYCDNWDQSKESQVIPALDHQFKYDDNRGDSFCMYCGLKECFHFLQEEKKDPTCETSGWRFDRCTFCQRKLNYETLPAIGHKMSNDLYYAGGNWIRKCQHRDCRYTEVAQAMNAAEIALYQDDVEGEITQPWEERAFANLEGDANLYPLYTYADAESEKRSEEFAQVIREQMPEASNSNLTFIANLMLMQREEADLDAILSIAAVDNAYSDNDAKKQALIDLGYDNDMADGLVNYLDINRCREGDDFSIFYDSPFGEDEIDHGDAWLQFFKP